MPNNTKNNFQENYEEIKKISFEVDDLLHDNPDCPVYGLNINCAWPIPENLKKAYEELRKELSCFGDDVYVYPHEETHITIMTLVNFKNHKNPSIEEIEEIKNLTPEITKIISDVLHNDLKDKIKPFKIKIDSPELARGAAFLPISNPTGEIFLLRNAITPILENKLSLKITYNKDFVHSTIMRFLKLPTDTEKFVNKFKAIAKNNPLGSTTIDEILLTAETRPYMRAGEILHTFGL